MDADDIRDLDASLVEYLAGFDHCFARKDTRGHLPVYIRGQLSNLQRKSIEPIALEAGVPVRTLQEFLAQSQWDEDAMRDRVQEIARGQCQGHEVIGTIDETSCVKKGDKTPGVQRHYLGCVGKQENGIVTVHLGCAAGDFHCLLDGELFLPQSWSDDRQRCRQAGIPEEVVYRPKSEIAIELYDRARAGGMHFDWITFDEWYADKLVFLRALDERDQKFIGEIPRDFFAQIDPPRITHRPYRRNGRGRPRKTPRTVAGSPKAKAVEELARSHRALRDQRWTSWHVKDTDKGPLVWRAKHVRIYVKDEDKLPRTSYHLLVCENPLSGETKYFVSNAPANTSVGTLLRVAFSRATIERCFEDHKGRVGLTHWEGRRWIALKRHLILTCVSYLFLATARQRQREKKSGDHDLPTPQSDQRGHPILVSR